MIEHEVRPLVLSGFNGLGKDYMMEWLARRYRCQRALSVMTRDRRPTEIEGVDGYFRTQTEHDQMSRRGEFVTSFEIMGHKYSIPKMEIERIDSVDEVPMVAMDARTVGAVKRNFPGMVGIFLEPTNSEIPIGRMVSRGDRDDDMDRRVVRSLLEIADYHQSDELKCFLPVHLLVDGTEDNFLRNVATIASIHPLVARI